MDIIRNYLSPNSTAMKLGVEKFESTLKIITPIIHIYANLFWGYRCVPVLFLVNLKLLKSEGPITN